MNSSYNKMQKVSIRFFNDREVRAVWDEMLSKWWVRRDAWAEAEAPRLRVEPQSVIKPK